MNARAESRQRPAAGRSHPGSPLSRLRAWREQHLYALVSSLGRLLRRPFATLLTVGVMAVAIALPLGLGLAMANIERFSGSVTESREIGVFLRPDVDLARAEALAEELRARPDVAGVTVRTPEEGLAEFRTMSDLAGALEVLEENPLPAVLVVRPEGDGGALAASLRELAEAEIVQHDALWRQRLSAWLAFGARVVQVLAVLLGLGVLLVVGNTVRLDIGARREEIAVLQQLGATDGFVRRPFLYLGAWYGLAAGLLALLLLAVAGAFLQGPLAALVASYGAEFRLAGPGWRGVGLLLAGALAMGWLGAWLATGHHLRQTRPTDV
ncbi:permease-like cell division protein FtsX [Arenimonas fontis]|uniref:Cell division protein FtsX n=1 Tax=Arenimonas fontis TaxID=2608255 RepID=A0A5B2ZC00_9GAMM|nr:permease-like cell division protein FtsX [Arenimonas fontis]KAA2284651.1 ABC transporter permease [Arenimonas fontis]